ncbi:hypothetical protein LTR36_003772 [Oleoguttula mirabilis]|uniref:Uncharacterized protein n=1 Tax=Oleoguttula mirabilis TaxID=1507867 RepID=A0AAV9JIW2_9PEZI|nr:hypothetical protein LTR36_003772 [Oleoguttula mirabilis]
MEADDDDNSEQCRSHGGDASRARRYWKALQLRQSLGRTYRRHFLERDWRQACVVESDVSAMEIESGVSCVQQCNGVERGVVSSWFWDGLDVYGRFWMKVEDLHESSYSLEDALEDAFCRFLRHDKAGYGKARSLSREDVVLLLAIATFVGIFLVLFGRTQYAAYRMNVCYWRCLLERHGPTYQQRREVVVHGES